MSDSYIKVAMTFGTVELEQRPMFDPDKGFGYLCRKVLRDRDGKITEIGEWAEPCCWLRVPQEEPPRPWWRFWA